MDKEHTKKEKVKKKEKIIPQPVNSNSLREIHIAPVLLARL
jgi:hypothetical protein